MALDRVVVDARKPENTERAPLIVLLHGFMSNPADLAPFARSLGVGARFVFPSAPLDLAPHGLRGRAWWPIDQDSRESRDSPGGGSPRALAEFVPEGLPAARACIDALMAELLADSPSPSPEAPLIVGGFSQGAMLTFDWALRAARPPRGLVQLSGAPMCMAEWRPRIAQLAGQRVFFSHGRADDDLSFTAVESFKDELTAAGWHVSWCPFDGGHEVPLIPLRALKKFLQGFVQAPRE